METICNRRIWRLTIGRSEFENCSKTCFTRSPKRLKKSIQDFWKSAVMWLKPTLSAAAVVLQEFGIADKAYDVNKLAASFAKNLANQYLTKEKPRFVAGSTVPGTKLPTLGHITYEDLKNQLFNKFTDFDLWRWYVRRSKLVGIFCRPKPPCRDLRFFKENESKFPLLLSDDWNFRDDAQRNGNFAALTTLEPFRIDVDWDELRNGSRQNDRKRQILVRKTLRFTFLVLPNAGLPEVKDGRPYYTESPEDFVKRLNISPKILEQHHRRRLLRNFVWPFESRDWSRWPVSPKRAVMLNFSSVRFIDLFPTALRRTIHF